MLKSNELLRILYCGKKGGQKYPEQVRHFCLGMVYYSPRAYEYLRKKFNNHLPNIQTIRNWFANSDIKSDPGMQEEHMQRLKKIVQEFEIKNNRKLLCSLIFDEMSIRQQVVWSMQQLEFDGFTHWQDHEKEERAIAKQAIVFILKGIEANFEFPVSYYFIDALDKQKRGNLVREIIATVTECGIKITNLTFDGLSANAAMCQLLGANLNVYDEKFQPFISNPVNNEKIYIILDPCHMIKLARNTLSNRKEFFAQSKKNKIEWRYIEALYNYSCKNGLKTHKLTKKHIEWKRHAMNVRLATQTFSNSVADAIQFLMGEGVPEFQGAEATVDFIRRMDKLFNIFNSKHSKDENIFKRVLSAENRRIFFSFFHDMKRYFKLLKVEEEYFIGKKKSPTAVKKFKLVPVIKTRNKCAFRGFIIDMESLMEMFVEYVEQEHLLSEIPTYNLLQDFIEMFFGRIRACGGYNNNPNVQQFKGAYRKVQANMNIDLSLDSNCRIFDMNLPDNLFFSNIYFVSSKKAKIEMDKNIYEEQRDSILDELDETAMFDTSFDAQDSINTLHANYHMLDSTSNFMTAYIASLIEKKIIQCNNFTCNDCSSVLSDNEKIDTISKHLITWKPCISTMEICKTAEKFFKLYDVQKPHFDFKVLYCMIFRSMNFDSIFPNSAFDCDVNHKYQFIKCIVGQYISIRANQVSQQITLERHDKLIRQQFNRLVNFKGQ